MRDIAAGPRVLLRRLREVMAEPIGAAGAARQDRAQIAANMVAEVCSLYVLRADGVLELYATEGLNARSVHLAQLRSARAWSARSRPRRGRSTCPTRSRIRPSPTCRRPARRSTTPSSACRCCAPAARSACSSCRTAPTALSRRGGRGAADHRHGARRDVRVRRAGAARHARRSSSTCKRPVQLNGVAFGEGVGLGHVVLHEPRVVVTELIDEDGDEEMRPARRGAWLAAAVVDDMLSRGDVAARASTATSSKPTACSPTTAAGCGGCRRRSATASPPRRRSRRCRATRARACCADRSLSCATGCTISTTSPTGCCAS